MIESVQDKSTLCSKLMPQGEKLVWDAFKANFHLSDTFNNTGKLRFTWDNKRRDECRILARLDRHYTSSTPGSNFYLATRNHVIIGDSPMSDHLHVSIEVILQHPEQRKTSYKMSTYYLKHAEVKRAVERIWSGERSEASTFFTRMRKFSKFYRSYCKLQARESRRLEAAARTDLVEAQGSLQEDPQNPAAQLLLAKRQAHLLTFETKKAEGTRIRSRLR